MAKPLGRVIGISKDGKSVVRENSPEALAANFAPVIRGSKALIDEETALRRPSEHKPARRPPKQAPAPKLKPAKLFDGFLRHADGEAYGPCREAYGGPDGDRLPSAPAQLLRRLVYYGALFPRPPRCGRHVAFLLLSKVPALVVVGRWFALDEIAHRRRRYRRCRAPAVPPWAARGRPPPHAPAAPSLKRLDGPSALVDDADGLEDDWADYDDVDASPPRRARFSRCRHAARWVPAPAPPAGSVRVLRLLGALRPSALESGQFTIRGGAALDAYGYAWGQSLTDAWAFVPLPPGSSRRHVSAKVERLGLRATVREDVAATTFGRAVLPDASALREPVLEAAFHAPVDTEGATVWCMDEQKVLGVKGPLAMVHKVLIITCHKAAPAWWPRFVKDHPEIRRRDFAFMTDDDT